MGSFVVLSKDQLMELMVTLQKYLPAASPIYYTADNARRGRLSTEEVMFLVNVWPYPTCVVLVSPASKGQLQNYRTTVDVLCVRDPSLIVSFFRHCPVLDWTQSIFFRILHPLELGELSQLQTLFEDKGGSFNCVKRHVYVLTKEPSATNDLTPDYQLLDGLSPAHAATVGEQYSAWGVQPEDTVRYFQACAFRLPSSGIETKDGTLAAYVALHHTSAFGSVVTQPEHQRKGLARLAVSNICRRMRNDEQVPYVFVNPENVASAKLYEACGFERKADALRIRFVPKE